MAVTSFFPIGCMKWQHAVILESIWEPDLSITHSLAQRTGRLTPLLTCLLYFSLFTWTNYSKSSSPSPFLFLDKNFLSPTSLLSSCWTKNILSPTSILQNYSKTIPNSVLVAKPIQFCKNILSPIPFLT